jgi:signal transduction histidine kinase
VRTAATNQINCRDGNNPPDLPDFRTADPPRPRQRIELHLKEMNLAAAGLAHETRNPLNIIRGLAQMISKQRGRLAGNPRQVPRDH